MVQASASPPGCSYLPGDPWSCVETILIATTEGMATSMYRSKTRDTAKYPVTGRSAPATKNDPVQNVNNAEVRNGGLG